MRTIRWWQFYSNAALNYGTPARPTAPDSFIRVGLLLQSSRVFQKALQLKGVIIIARCIAKYNKRQVLITVPAARYPTAEHSQLGNDWAE